MLKITGLSVVIPNYNGVGLFPLTLPTVFRALEASEMPFELIVADDCSTDASVAYLQENFPNIRIVNNEKNSGFSVTANRGIRAAKYELVLLLNSDVKLEPGYFKPQLRFFEKPDTFGVMGRIVGWEDDEIQDSAKYPSFHNAKIKTNKNYLPQNEEEIRQGLYTMYVSGANALFNRQKFLEIGGFNEMFAPFYVEDYELSLRAWRLGWKSYYEHNAICRHRTSTTIRSKSRKSFIKTITNRNKWYVHAIHLEPGQRLLWMLQLIPEIIFQSLLLKAYYVKAFFLFLKSSADIKRSRQQIQELAKGKKLLTVKQVAELVERGVSSS